MILSVSNLIDYVHWRGDLSFDQCPVGEVDELLFSQLAYISFGPFVPTLKLFPHYVTLQSAAQRLLEYDSEGKRIHQHSFMWKNLRTLLETCAQAPRYRDIPLCAYVDELTEETQFAAICFLLPGEMNVIAFRGTDDSVTGWKEDLLMALSDPIPAQVRSAEYLSMLSPLLTGKLLLTGHSKGGNLSVFAACKADESIRSRIDRIANLDGPGFSRALRQSLDTADIRNKVRIILPESSVVGRLLEQEENISAVVEAKALGLLQHDAFTWQVMGNRLIRAEGMTPYSEYMTVVARDFLNSLSETQREEFLREVFETLSHMDARTLRDAPAAFFSALPQMVKSLRTVDKEHKDKVLRLMVDLGEAALRTLVSNIQKKGKELLPSPDSKDASSIDKDA